MEGELYEKLYKENQELINTNFLHERYIEEWKKRFGYDNNVSFDKLLEDMYELKYGKRPY